MSFQIVWLPEAARDVARLRLFIKSKDPRAAKRAAQRLLDGVKLLVDNSEAGAPVENLMDYRDLLLPFGAGEYIVRYRTDGNRIVIVRVRHSRENDF